MKDIDKIMRKKVVNSSYYEEEDEDIVFLRGIIDCMQGSVEAQKGNN